MDGTNQIHVSEFGESKAYSLTDDDVAYIRAVGRGDEGAIFPKASRQKPLLTVERLSGGKCKIRARGAVGIVPLPSGRVLRVNSKLGKNVGKKVGKKVGVFWLLFHALSNKTGVLPRWTAIPDTDNPLEWLFLLLRQEVRKLVQAGLRKDYIPIEETSGFVRGRVLPARTIAETRGLAHQITCLYDDFTADVFDNRVLRLALREGARHVPDDKRHQLLGTDALFDGEVTFERTDLAQTAKRLKALLDQKHPGRAAYVPAHTLAYMVLSVLSAGGEGRGRRRPGILLNMDKLFEDALRNMLVRDFGSAGFGSKFVFERGVSLRMGPDIILPDLLVDAKYKKKPLLVRGGASEPELPLSNDLYQAHTYSYFGKCSCALVYAVGEGAAPEIREKLQEGCKQINSAKSPRVGLFCLDISGESFAVLDSRRDRLIDQLQKFQSVRGLSGH